MLQISTVLLIGAFGLASFGFGYIAGKEWK